MKFFCVSDIYWEHPTIDIVERLRGQIDDIDPDAVLFAGDVIGDGRNEKKHPEEFMEVLSYLESQGVSSFIVQGNNDEVPAYSKLKKEISVLSHATEISKKVVYFEGTKILGVPFSYTNKLGDVRQIGDQFPESYDIVLAHAQKSRRIWLFELDTDLIITGHFSEELCQVKDKVFLSMDSYPEDSAVIKEDEISYNRFNPGLGVDTTTVSIEEETKQIQNRKRVKESPGFQSLTNSSYSEQAELLLLAKEEIEQHGKNEEEVVRRLLARDIPKTHIKEYIGRYDFL